MRRMAGRVVPQPVITDLVVRVSGASGPYFFFPLVYLRRNDTANYSNCSPKPRYSDIYKPEFVQAPQVGWERILRRVMFTSASPSRSPSSPRLPRPLPEPRPTRPSWLKVGDSAKTSVARVVETLTLITLPDNVAQLDNEFDILQR